MTSAITVGVPRFRPVNAGLVSAAAVVAVLLVVGQETVRRAEAFMSALFLNLLQIAPANSIETAVIFPVDGRYVGFTVAPGCTAALLIVPFVVVAGVLLLVGRVNPVRATTTVAVFSFVVVMVNQLRLAVIAISMRSWGFPKGYDRSHVLLGSLVSTIGVAGGLLLFLRIVNPRRSGNSVR